MLQHWLSAYAFDLGSNRLPNGAMETSSYWQASGGQSSFWLDGSDYYMGSHSMAWQISPQANLAGVSQVWTWWGINSGTTGYGAGSYAVSNLFDTNVTTPDDAWLIAWPVREVSSPYEPRSGTSIHIACASYQCFNGFRALYISQFWSTDWAKQFKLYGSNVGSFRGEETYLGASPLYTSWPSGTWKTWSLSHQTGWLFYRIYCNGNIPEWLKLNELELSYYGVDGQVEGMFTGSNYVFCNSVPATLYAGSHYEMRAVAKSNLTGVSLRLQVVNPNSMTVVRESPVQGINYLDWTRISATFSLAGDVANPIMRIAYAGPGYQNTIHVDDVYLGDTQQYRDLGAVELYPEWEMKRYRKRLSSDHRTKVGALFSYTWGTYERFEIPIKHMSRETALIVNSWWQAADLVLLRINSGGAWETNSLAIVNKQAPFREMDKPYTDQMQGTLELETV